MLLNMNVLIYVAADHVSHVIYISHYLDYWILALSGTICVGVYNPHLPGTNEA
jgi:hypothetical protein